MKSSTPGIRLILHLVALPILLPSLACTPKPADRPIASAPPQQAKPATPPAATPVGARPEFRCTLLLGLTVTNEWFSAGFETALSDPHWEARLRPHTFVDDWADPEHEAWQTPIASPCADRPESPDRVVVVVANWKLADAAAWNAPLLRLIGTVRQKFPDLRRLELLTMLRAPQNVSCGDPKSIVEPFVDQALKEAAATSKELVRVGPELQVPSCDVFEKGGPHFTESGRAIVAKLVALAYPSQ